MSTKIQAKITALTLRRPRIIVSYLETQSNCKRYSTQIQSDDLA